MFFLLRSFFFFFLSFTDVLIIVGHLRAGLLRWQLAPSNVNSLGKQCKGLQPPIYSLESTSSCALSSLSTGEVETLSGRVSSDGCHVGRDGLHLDWASGRLLPALQHIDELFSTCMHQHPKLWLFTNIFNYTKEDNMSNRLSAPLWHTCFANSPNDHPNAREMEIASGFLLADPALWDEKGGKIHVPLRKLHAAISNVQL